MTVSCGDTCSRTISEKIANTAPDTEATSSSDKSRPYSVNSATKAVHAPVNKAGALGVVAQAITSAEMTAVRAAAWPALRKSRLSAATTVRTDPMAPTNRAGSLPKILMAFS